jgi:branched-chain amino acid transport system substrate-binding protein
VAGQQIRYVLYDDASDSTKALQNIKRLILEDKADLILGPSITTCTLGVIDTVAENRTPIISTGSATQIVSPMDEKRKWVFKTPADDAVYNEAMIHHMVKKGVKTVSIITMDDPYGESNTKEFNRLAGPLGIKTLNVEKFGRGDTSVTPQVLRVMKSNPDAVYVIAVGTASALPQLALYERRYKGSVYHTGSVVSAEFLRVGGKALQGAYVPTSPVVIAEQLPDGNPTKSEALRFLRAYETKFGPRSHFAGQIWDALGIMNLALAKALKTAKPGTPEFREAVRAAIENTKNYNGSSAIYNFSPEHHSGISLPSMAVVRVEDGAWKLER